MRLFLFLITLLLLTLPSLYAQEKEYSLNVDAIWDADNETMRDTSGKAITGMVKGYDEIGKLISTDPYKDGKRDGILTVYLFIGGETRKLEYPFKNGKKEGTIRLYYGNGKVSLETPYKDDFAEGISKTYFNDRDGYVEAEYPYVKGRIHGLAKLYHSTGELRVETFYKDGLEEGISKEYRRDGTLRNEVTMRYGRKNGLAKYYYRNGSILEVQYKDDAIESALCVGRNPIPEGRIGNGRDWLYEVCKMQF
jgi:antitoxin component YwqK of YwqJK toxin-antitoxin module